MRSHLYAFLKFFIGLPLTLLALFFIFKIIAPQTPILIAHLHTIHIFLFCYGVLSFVIFYFLKSYIWHRILKNYHYTISFKETNYLWAIANLRRYIPGNIWSFVSATMLFQKKGIQKKDIGKAFILEAELFVLGSAILSLLALPFYFTHTQISEELSITAFILLITILYCYGSKIQSLLSGKLQRLFSLFLPPFSIIENAFLIWISMIALFFFGLGNYLVITSVVFLNPRFFLELIGIFDFAFVVGFLSVVTPAGFGVREGIVIFSLAKIISSGLSAFSALFCRIILICSELIFIIVSTFWCKLHNAYLKRLEILIGTYPQISIVAVLTLIYILYFTIVSFLRYDNFYTGRFDLGNMAQTVWNTLHGRIFLSTDPNGTQEISRLAFHADFILVFLTPFFALWQNPKMLLLIQTFIVATGAFFLYFIVKEVLKNRNLALVFAFAYLINPSVQRANIYDFHAVTLVTTFFFATYYFFLKKRYGLFIIFAFLAALCKEQIWLIISLFGLIVFFVHKKRLLGGMLFLFSLGMFYYLIWIAIPHTLGSQHFALAYFSDYGDSPTKVVKGIVFSPHKIIQTILEPTRLAYLNELFMPIGYLILFYPFFLIFAGPDLLIDLLSNNPQLHQIYYQYTTTITPFVILGAIYAILWLRKIKIARFTITQAQWNLFFVMYLLTFALYTAYAYGPLPGSRDPNLDMFTKQLPHRAYINNFLTNIPKEDSVAASNDIGSHLSTRENIYTIPSGLDRADVVVLLITDQQTRSVFSKVSKDHHYRKVTQKDNFVAFERL